MAAARTGTTPAAGTATETEFSSAAQRERRQRILDATLALASRGGYEAVQMRAVADRAGVALGTLYRYFPSKIHLLVSGLAREFERNQEKLDRISIPGDTPYERMLTGAMHEGEPTADEIAIARVIGDVWLSSLVAWVTRRASANVVTNHLVLAARLLLR